MGAGNQAASQSGTRGITFRSSGQPSAAAELKR